jgi:hypothetical protein
MAQTPISASVLYNSTTPTTIYTVPSGKTAVVKGVLATSLTSSYDAVTINKVSGGITYPIVKNTVSGYDASTSTYYVERGVATLNLLQAPITLAAGDSISISSTGTSYYKTLNVSVSNSNFRIGNIAYLNGNYVVVGVNNATGVGLILTSTDGITYTQRTFTASVYLTNVTYGNGYYVVCNSTGAAIHYSTDLVTWTQVSLPSTSACYAITYGGGKFVTGGASGKSYYATTTPLSWTASTVFNANTIYAIAYIGTNYFFGVSATSYYTADFTTYTQPYVGITTAGVSYNTFAAGNNKILMSNNTAPYNYPNTFLKTSTDGGVNFTDTTTVANNMLNYAGYPVYAANGGFWVYRYNNSGNNGSYIYSADGVTWNASTYSFLTGYSNNGGTIMSAAWMNTSVTAYQNRVLIFQYSGGNWYIQGCNVSSGGFLGTETFSFSSSTYSAGSYVGEPVFAGNPYDGSWRSIGYYSNGGDYTCPSYYSSSSTSGSDSNRNQGLNNGSYGYAVGYGQAIGVVPGNAKYLAGTTNGWVLIANGYSNGWSPIMGNPAWITSPTGFDWNSVNSVPVVGFARSGDLSTSTLVIIWNNGYFATTTNQGTSYTFGFIGMTSIASHLSLTTPPIQYNNGKFYVVNGAGQVCTSPDGLVWTTMISNVDNIYYLNSQNVFSTTAGAIVTSATGVVDTFTLKSTTSAFAGNPSTNKIIYANSVYYNVDASGNLYSSSDLITWTSKQFNTTSFNDTTYFSTGSYGALAYSGAGTAIVASNGKANGASASSTGNIGTIFTPSSSIYIGNATASIVQID